MSVSKIQETKRLGISQDQIACKFTNGKLKHN